MKKALRKGVGIMIAMILIGSCLTALAIGFSPEKVYESVFVIETNKGIGSGFAVGENEVLTNAHVISGARSVSVVTYAGERYAATTIGYSEELDLALLFIENASFSPLSLNSLKGIQAGDDVYAVGAPKSMAYTLTKGIISSKGRTIRGREFIQIDAAVNEGNSGGPLLNAEGEVLGVITLKMSDAEGIGLAIPITVASDWMNGVDTSSPAATEAGQNTTWNDTDGPQGSPPESVPQNTYRTSKVNSALVIALSLSLLLNIAFAVTFVLLRRKNKPIPKPSPDRTDFEIEFEE